MPSLKHWQMSIKTKNQTNQRSICKKENTLEKVGIVGFASNTSAGRESQSIKL